LRPAAYVFAAGALLLLLLGGAGALLGRLTLRRLHRRGPDITRFDPRGGRALRRCYRRVLFACALHYYVVLPLMGLLVAGSVAGALHGYLDSGQLPIIVSVVMLLFGGILLFGVIEAAFLRPRERRNDEVLDLEANPSLSALL